MIRNTNTSESNEMKNLLYCIKEIALMFALLSMIMLAAFGGTAILLSNI